MNLQTAQSISLQQQKIGSDSLFLMHTVSGDVATKTEWLKDFKATDRETWFGLPIEECKDLHPIYDLPHLVKVEFNGEEWVEA
jgi:hypothetical protein